MGRVKKFSFPHAPDRKKEMLSDSEYLARLLKVLNQLLYLQEESQKVGGVVRACEQFYRCSFDECIYPEPPEKGCFFPGVLEQNILLIRELARDAMADYRKQRSRREAMKKLFYEERGGDNTINQ